MKEHCLSYQACLSNSDLEELKVYYHALKRSFDLVKESPIWRLEWEQSGMFKFLKKCSLAPGKNIIWAI